MAPKINFNTKHLGKGTYVRRVGARGDAGAGAARRPRPVILTLARSAPRDQLLKAARVRRGLTTEMLNIPGSSQRVYLNEHLTRENRILFSKARKLGGELGFKYVWTSYGKILMRRTETSSVLQVSSESTLDKLKTRNSPPDHALAQYDNEANVAHESTSKPEGVDPNFS